MTSTRRCGLLWLRGADLAPLGGSSGEADGHELDVVWQGGGYCVLAFDDPFGAVGAARRLVEHFPDCRLALHFGRLVTAVAADRAHTPGAATPAQRGEPWGPASDLLCALGAVAAQGQALASGAFCDWVRVEDTIGVEFSDFGLRRLQIGAAPVRVLALEFGQNSSTSQLALGATNLPSPRGGFTGRDTELARLEALCEQGSVVTVVGMGGAGKTRLALEFGIDLWRQRPGDDVWFVELAQATTFAELVAATGATFDIPLAASSPRDDILATLGRALATRGDVLLILDNAEQIADELADCLEALVEVAPEARWLVTSRHRLGMPREKVLELNSLDEAAAVRLFTRRLRRVRPDFSLTEAHLETIVELVGSLDRLPLALEIAASRGRLTPIEELDAKLFDEATGVHASRAERHATLADVVAWSWQLLSQRERDVLVQCAAFSGAFTLESARGVIDACAPDELEETISALVEHSLLETLESPSVAGEVAVRVYLPVVEFVRAEAEASALERAYMRHLEVYDVLSASWREGARGPEQVDALDRIAFEAHELHAAFRRAVAAGDPRAGSLALALYELYSVRGPVRPASAVLEEALAIDGIEDHPRLYARLLVAQSYLHSTMSLPPMVESPARRALEVLREAGIEDEDTAEALRMLARSGDTACPERDGDEALEEALEIARTIEAPSQQALVLYEMSGRFVDQGRCREAIATAAQGIEFAERAANPRALAMLMGVRGLSALHIGHFDEARDFSRRALAIFERLGMLHAQALTLLDLGSIALEDDISGGIGFFARGLRIGRQHGMDLVAAAACASLGQAHMLRADFAKARRYLQRGLEHFGSEQPHLMRVTILLSLAPAEHALGHTQASERRFAEADRALEHHPPNAWHGVRAVYKLIAELPAGAEGQADAESIDATREKTEELVASFDDLAVERAARIVDGYLELVDGRAEEGGEDAILVGRSVRWFQPPDGDRIDISRRRALRRIVESLVDQRLKAPGEPLPLDDLVAAGWPGEKLHPSSAKNRVYVAIASLRDLGLRDVLLNEGGGYLLSPKMAVQWQDAGE